MGGQHNKRRSSKKAAKAEKAPRAPKPPKARKQKKENKDKVKKSQPTPEQVRQIESVIRTTEERMNSIEELLEGIMKLAKIKLENDKPTQSRKISKELARQLFLPEPLPLEPEAGPLPDSWHYLPPLETVPGRGDDAETETDSQPNSEKNKKDRVAILSQLESLLKTTETLQKGLHTQIEDMESQTSNPLQRMWSNFFG